MTADRVQQELLLHAPHDPQSSRSLRPSTWPLHPQMP